MPLARQSVALTSQVDAMQRDGLAVVPHALSQVLYMAVQELVVGLHAS